MKNLLRVLIIAALGTSLSGCFLTKVITVPMRIGGAVISVVPVVGNTADAAIDTAADVIDAIPL